MILDYFTHLLIISGIYAIIAMSLNMTLGVTGLINLGQIAISAIGAYVSALLMLSFGIPFWIAILASGIVAALISLLTVIPTLKLKGDYLAIATLGFAIVIEAILKNWMDVTRGPLGLPGIPKPEIFGFTITGFNYLILVTVICATTYFILKFILKSPFGRVLKAIRDDEIVAKSLGKNTVKYKAQILMITAFFAGIAGSLYAHYISYIDPSSFNILDMIFVLSIVIIGGLGSLEGSITGTLLLVIIPELLRFLPIPSFAVGALRQMIYAGILLYIILKKPGGLMGEKHVT